MHLQVGDDRTLRCYCHHDLGVSLHLDTMRLSQAWRCALAVAGWTVPSCVRCALSPPLLNARAPAADPPTAHTRESENNTGRGGDAPSLSEMSFLYEKRAYPFEE